MARKKNVYGAVLRKSDKTYFSGLNIRAPNLKSAKKTFDLYYGQNYSVVRVQKLKSR